MHRPETTNDPPGFIEEWACKIKQLRLAAPAILLLEAHKPLSFVASQFMLVGQPLLDIFLPAHFTTRAISVFADRTYLEHLLAELQQD